MFRIFGIVQDLVDVLPVRPFQKTDLSPGLAKIGLDLDLLVLAFVC